MNQELYDYIMKSAQARGIDPKIALKVASSEGGLNNPFRHGEGPAPKSQDPRFGPKENSHGPFQLYVSGNGAGLGDRALAAGIDPSKDWQGGVDFALDEVGKKGWGQWYGAKKAGITGMMGVGQRPDGAPMARPMSMASNGPPGLSLMGAGGGVNNPANGVPPLPTPVNVASHPVMDPIAAPAVPGALAAGAAPAIVPPAAPAPSIASMIGSGDWKGALGGMGASGGLFSKGVGALASAVDKKPQAAPIQAAPIDDNSASIAQQAPQLMAQLMAMKKKRQMGMSLGGGMA